MSDINEVEVDTSDFLAEVDRVIEAAANRDAQLAEVEEQYLAVIADLAAERESLEAQMAALRKRGVVVAQVRETRRRAIFTEFVGNADVDPEPF